MKFTPITAALLLQITSPYLFAVEHSAAKEITPIVDPLSGTNVVQMIVGLFVVLVLVFVIAWLLRRVGGVSLGGGSAIKVIAGMSMGARERVVLLQVGEEQLLIGISPGRVQTLHKLENPIEIEEAPKSGAIFADKLADALRGKNK